MKKTIAICDRCGAAGSPGEDYPKLLIWYENGNLDLCPGCTDIIERVLNERRLAYNDQNR